MKIWFDLSNSPHINMFYDLIRDLESEGHEIIITSRPLANTIALLDQKNLRHTVIGKHYGKKIISKLIGFPIRIYQLVIFLKKLKPDLAVSQSSFHSPITAKLLRIPSIYTNDNEHASGNIIGFYFATKILVPENIELNKFSSNSKVQNKMIKYPGLKEGLYLWNLKDEINKKRNELPLNPLKIYFRPEPQTAQYYNGKINFMDETLCALQQSHDYELTIFPRDNRQIEYYSQDKFKNISVSNKPISFNEIAASCGLFIGAGGSMTRELAILGIPTISVYQENLLDVDRILIEKKLLKYEPSLTITKIEKFIQSKINTDCSMELLNKGKMAYSIFKKEILKHNLV